MVNVITSAVLFSAVFLYGCLGEILTEKSGHLNLGIPGIMCMGTAGGAYGVTIVMNAADAAGAEPSYILLLLAALAFGFLFGAAAAAIYGFFTITLRCNQNISGLALTTLGSGLAQFVMNGITADGIQKNNLSKAGTILSRTLPFANDLGLLGQLFLSYGVLVYIAIVVAIIMGIVLKRTRLGLHLRAVGENPATADAVGINVTAYKYGAVTIGGGIAGLGGMFYLLDYAKGSFENSSTIEGLGWLCIALVIFVLWKPNVSILGSILFGLLYLLGYRLGISEPITQNLFKMLPYVVTIIVLIVLSIIDTRENQPPQALGLPYFREER